MRRSWRVVALTLAVPIAIVCGPVGPASAASGGKHFRVQGLVLSKHGNKVRVLASTTTVGKRTTATPHVVTLTVSSKVRRHITATQPGSPAPTSPLSPGRDIVATGTVSGSHFAVTAAGAQVLPAQALIGTIVSVGTDGNTLTVARHDHVSGNACSDDNDELILVDINGAPTTGPAPAVGQYLVVLGESDDHSMLAAAIYTFAAAPSLVAGRVLTADPTGNLLTMAARGHEDHGQDDDGNQDGHNQGAGNHDDAVHPADDGESGALPPVAISTAGATVVVNGVSGLSGTAAFPAVADKVLAVGNPDTTDPTRLDAVLVLDFNGQDQGSVADNEHDGHDGHHDSTEKSD